jgi:hypothetical protein
MFPKTPWIRCWKRASQRGREHYGAIASDYRRLHNSGCHASESISPGTAARPKIRICNAQILKNAGRTAKLRLIHSKRRVESGVDAVMIAHILYPALDETDIAS